MLKKLNLGSAMVAGIVATGAMTLLMYTAPLIGLPKMDIMLTLGSLFPWQLSPYIPGAILHFGIGSVLALLYALFFAHRLPGLRWMRGALYALLPWLLAISAMGPMTALVQSWTTPAMASLSMNPCAAVNPCGVTTRPANPCAIPQGPANPCSPVKSQALNPCAAKMPQAMNPCGVATQKPLNPCGATASPGQATPSPTITRLMSLIAHLVYGAVLGFLYQPREDGKQQKAGQRPPTSDLA